MKFSTTNWATVKLPLSLSGLPRPAARDMALALGIGAVTAVTAYYLLERGPIVAVQRLAQRFTNSTKWYKPTSTEANPPTPSAHSPPPPTTAQDDPSAPAVETFDVPPMVIHTVLPATPTAPAASVLKSFIARFNHYDL